MCIGVSGLNLLVFYPLILQALGLKPKVARIEDQPKLGKKELESLLKRGGGGAAGTDTAAAGSDADRIKGLGFAAP